MLAIANKLNPEMETELCDVLKYKPQKSYDAIIEWWCLFHMPVDDQLKLIGKFYQWLKPKCILQFTSGETAFKGTNSDVLNQPLNFYSANKAQYMEIIKLHGYKLIKCDSDQENHFIWTLEKQEEYIYHPLPSISTKFAFDVLV